MSLTQERGRQPIVGLLPSWLCIAHSVRCPLVEEERETSSGPLVEVSTPRSMVAKREAGKVGNSLPIG